MSNLVFLQLVSLSIGYALGGTLPASVSDQEWSDFLLLSKLRTDGYECPGGIYFGPNPNSLVFDCRLWAAAHLHSEDMAENSFFSHTSLDGRSARDRGYEQDITINGENIAAALPAAADVLDKFKTSEFHCQNIMDPSFTLFGSGYYYSPTSQHIYYWTQTFSRGLPDNEDPVQTWCYDDYSAATTSTKAAAAATATGTTATTTTIVAASSADSTTLGEEQGEEEQEEQQQDEEEEGYDEAAEEGYVQLQGTLTLHVIGSAETLANISELLRPSVVAVLADYVGADDEAVEVQLIPSKIQEVTSEDGDGARRLRARKLQHSSTVVTVLFTADMLASAATTVSQDLNSLSLSDFSSKLMVQLASSGITSFEVEASALEAEIGRDLDVGDKTTGNTEKVASGSSEPALSSAGAFAIGLGASFIIVVLAALMLVRRRGCGRGRLTSAQSNDAAEATDLQQQSPPVMDCLACTFENDHPNEPHGLEHSLQSTCKHFAGDEPRGADAAAAASSASLAPALPTLISKRSIASKDQAAHKERGDKAGSVPLASPASEDLANYFGPPYNIPQSPFAGERESLGETDTSSSAPPSETETAGLEADALSQNRLNLAIAARLATRHGTFRSKSAWSTSRSSLQKQLSQTSAESGYASVNSGRGDCRTARSARSACGSIPEHEAVEDSLWEQQQKQLYREQQELLRRLPTEGQDVNAEEGQVLAVWPQQIWEAASSPAGSAPGGVGTFVPQSARTVQSMNSMASGNGTGTFCGVPTCGPLAKRAMV